MNGCADIEHNGKSATIPDGRITIWGYPYTSEVIRVYFVLDELSAAIFVNVNAPGLTMVNLAPHHSWIGTGFHFKTSNAIIVNIVCLKITLKRTSGETNIILWRTKESKSKEISPYESIIKRENSDISAMVNMVSSHHRISLIFNPDARQRISAYFIVFICSLNNTDK